ncbi:MAG: PKD domain-containing protein [Chloroflexi bacterium]|nr:MAG: PKD domain-containing protein [Chloroflexota bacterium]
MGVAPTFRRAAVVLLAFGLWVITAVPVAASDQIDQSNGAFSGQNALRNGMAQTFTPGVSGQLDRVSLMMAATSGAVTGSVQIQTVSAGKPSGTVLGSRAFSSMVVACCHQWRDFTFSPTISLSAGTLYAIVVRPTIGIFTWYDTYYFDEYTSGQLWLAAGSDWLYNTSYGRDFCFETWMVSGAANQPPAIGVTSSVLTVNEGSTASNSGTYSDPDSDSVALTASSGTLTKTGTSTGAWAWSMPGTDEGPPQTITVTANDGHGHTTSTSFTVTIAGVPPTVSITGAPANGPEGTPITLTGKATSPSPADTAFTYTWNVTKNGNPFGSGSGPTISVTPDDEGTFVATLTAVDDGGNGATSAVAINGANVKPTALIDGASHASFVLLPLQTVDFSGGFSDPGALDGHTSTLDYGDGSPVDSFDYGTGGSGQVHDSFAYSRPGTYTITYTVTDDDGGVGVATYTITVQTPAEALAKIADFAASMASLDKGEKNGLLAKFRAASASAARGDYNATCGQLDAAMNDIEALSKNGRLSADDAKALGEATWAVHRAVGCTKVKVGWLTFTV